MPTESGDSRDVNEGDDTEETGGLSIKTERSYGECSSILSPK